MRESEIAEFSILDWTNSRKSFQKTKNRFNRDNN